MRPVPRSLPPYTVPEGDDDLWSCGKRVTGDDMAPLPPTQDELARHVLALLMTAGPEGIAGSYVLARMAGVTHTRIETALSRLRISRHAPILHPEIEHATRRERHEREDRERAERIRAHAEKDRADRSRLRTEGIRGAATRLATRHDSSRRSASKPGVRGTFCPCGSRRHFRKCHGAAV